MASRCSQVCITRSDIEVDRDASRSVRRKRTKKSTVAAQHLCPNLGTDGAVCRAALRTSAALPTQITFSSAFLGIHTHPSLVDGFPIPPKGSLGEMLAIVIGICPTCTDGSRSFRLRGFANCENDPAYHGTVEYSGDSTRGSDEFRLDIPASDAILLYRTFTARKDPSNPTDPEHNWSWVLHGLARGKVAAKLTRKLTSRRADKPKSLYYAQTAADVVMARLWLVQSDPIEVVVTLLEVRRRPRIPFGTPPRSWVGVHRLFTRNEGIVPRSISSQSKNGASHRENCDTPPLRGCCRAFRGAPGRPVPNE